MASATYKLAFNGNTLTYPGWAGYMAFEKIYYLTVTSDEYGSLYASVYTGHENDTSELTYNPNTYYGFSGYTLEGGGSIAGNTYTFGSENATAKAWFSANNYTITTANDGHGTCTCNKNSVTGGSTATLSNTPSTHYAFNAYQVTGGSVNGSTLTVTANCTAKATFSAKKYSITLQTDGHGKLTCNASTATGGQTVTLTPTYSSYYRFNNYSITGGSVNGNTLTVTANCTAKANFKVNSFTASGGFEKGSNVNVIGNVKNTTITSSVRKYAITGYKTSNVPASWYATSNRWQPSNASAYKITLNYKMCVTGKTGGNANVSTSSDFATLIGNTYSNTARYGITGANKTYNAYYSKTSITSNVQSNYSVSAYIRARGGTYVTGTNPPTSTYIATATTGTWVATGYIP